MADDKQKTSPEEERRKRLQCYASRGPGPAGVNLPPTVGFMNHDKTKRQMPAYTLASRWKTLTSRYPSPGPTYMVNPGLTSKGPYIAPAYTLRKRTKIIGELNVLGPGPAAYLPDLSVNRNRQPAYSLRNRTKLLGAMPYSPGPIYALPTTIGPKIPDKNAAAECSLKGRGKDFKRAYNAGFYDIGSPDLIKNKGGAASIKGRNDLKKKYYEASPASYNLATVINKIRPQPPVYSLGIRHSECAGTMFTACDKSADENCGCENNNNSAGDAC